MITQERLKELLSFDQKSGKFYWNRSSSPAGWAWKKEREAGFMSTGYRRIKIDKKSYLSHRLAWLWEHGEFPKFNIDHINGIRTDNRLSNLREAPAGTNIMNVPIKANNTTGHKGVFWKKSIWKWQVAVGANKRQHHIGYFSSLDDAVAASIEARNRLHGQFANHG